jgi:FixJ family two-component response regulator
MPSHKTIQYIGSDNDMFSKLISLFVPLGYDVQQWAEEIEGESWEDWYRVVLLDADVAGREGLGLLRTIKDRHAGIPVLVLARGEHCSLTQVALARLNGAEALLFKGQENSNELISVVAASFRRLDRWTEVLRGCLETAGR